MRQQFTELTRRNKKRHKSLFILLALRTRLARTYLLRKYESSKYEAHIERTQNFKPANQSSCARATKALAPKSKALVYHLITSEDHISLLPCLFWVVD
jgi:hypothetical protein